MAGVSTISGGGSSILVNLSGADIAKAQNALNALLGGGALDVLTSPSQTPDPTKTNILNIAATSAGQVINVPAGVSGVAITGDYAADIEGNGSNFYLIGNNGNDTINGAGGSGTIFSGDGNDLIKLNRDSAPGGTVNINLGSGNDTIQAYGGTASISQLSGGTTTYEIMGGTNTITTMSDPNIIIEAGPSTNYLNLDSDFATNITVYGGATTVTGLVGSLIVDHGNMDATLAGVTTVNIAGTSNDTIAAGGYGSKISLSESSSNKVRINVTGGANDTVYAFSGENTITAGSNMDIHLDGGHSTLNLTGLNDTVYIYGGTNIISNVVNDTVYAFGGTSTITASSNDEIHLDTSIDPATGAYRVSTTNLTLTGNNDTVKVYDGNATINVNGDGSTDYDYFKGTHLSVNQLTSGDFNLSFFGNDTVHLGTGNDTITEYGTATVYGGSGKFVFQGVSGNDSIMAGSGYSTLLGGNGNETFIGSTGYASMVGGTGNDTYVGGSGFDTMNAYTSNTALFVFNSTAAGGTHVIQNFTDINGDDKIHLVGYDSAAALASAKVVGGNTVISLDNGHTTITLTNFTSLNSSDFK